MKPKGIALGFNESGPTLRVTQSSQVEDAIWNAVEQAIWANWTPEQFRKEAAQAWKEKLEKEAKSAFDLLSA